MRRPSLASCVILTALAGCRPVSAELPVPEPAPAGATAPASSAEAPAPAPVLDPDTRSTYMIERGCSSCADKKGECLRRVADSELLGCGWASGDGRVAVSFTLETTATDKLDEYEGGYIYDHRYSFWSSEGQMSGEWSICDDMGIGCDAAYWFVPEWPLALFNYGESGGGGSTNGVVNLDTGERIELEAIGHLRPELSPDGTRLAYEDLTDMSSMDYSHEDGRGRLAGRIWCLELDGLRETAVGSSANFDEDLMLEDEVTLTWLDDTRLEVALRRDEQLRARVTISCAPE